MSHRLSLSATDQQLIRAVKRKSGNIWVVGGAIRDLLLGNKPKDIDYVTDLPPGLSAGAVSEMGLTLIPDRTAWEHGIIRIVGPNGPIDLSTTRQDVSCDGRNAQVEFTSSIRDDLARRDLTFNAIAAEIFEDGELGTFIDPFRGQEDLAERRINFVGDPEARIREDYLRMVRACRFTALDTGFILSDELKLVMRKYAHELKNISKERIRDEIIKALGYNKPSAFFRSLVDCELLIHVIPDLQSCIGIDQNEYHAEPVFDHLLFCLDASVDLTDKPLLRLATLLHDVGKPATKTFGSDGRAHFYEHEVRGASIVYKWMKDMKFSSKDTEYVTKLVRHHQWRFMEDSKDKTIRRWLRDVGEEWRDLITLRCADRKGNMAKQHKSMITQKMRELMARAEAIIASGDPIFDKDLAINGNDLKTLGIKPGPIYKEIFQKVWGLVINEPHRNNKEYLLDFVKRTCINDSRPKEDSEDLDRGADQSQYRDSSQCTSG